MQILAAGGSVFSAIQHRLQSASARFHRQVTVDIEADRSRSVPRYGLDRSSKNVVREGPVVLSQLALGDDNERDPRIWGRTDRAQPDESIVRGELERFEKTEAARAQNSRSDRQTDAANHEDRCTKLFCRRRHHATT